MRAGTSCAVILGALVAIACSSSSPPPTATKTVAPDTLCFKGSLVAGSVVAGVLSPSGGCMALDFLTGESTFTNVFTLPVKVGRGYLVTLAPSSVTGLFGRLELMTDTSVNPQASDSLLAIADAPPFNAGSMLLAGGADTAYAIRVTTGDNLPADTGAYSIMLQSCRMPLPPITDSVTHTDTLTGQDCLLQNTPLDSTDGEIIHVYLIHSSGSNLQRTISFHASAPVRMTISGPPPAAYDQIPFAYWTSLDTATTFDVFVENFPPQGNVTLVIGTPSLLPVQYTLTVGSEQPIFDRVRKGGVRSLAVRSRYRAAVVGATGVAPKDRTGRLSR